MNNTEEKALKWIASNFNLKPSEISIEPGSPEFSVKDGRKFAAKYVYGGKTVVFQAGEFDKLISNPRVTLLLFIEGETKPVRQLPQHVLLHAKEGLEGIKFVHMEGENRNGSNGEMMIKLSRRNPQSRYYRVGHMPIESLMAWPEGNYALKRSVEAAGGLQFWLVLSPGSY